MLDRQKYIDLENKSILISNIETSSQANDLTEPTNCNGFGRIRHFRRYQENWLDDPLPIDPACHALHLERVDMMRTQVFQMAYCNMNCWYCFVPDDLRNAKKGKWFNVEELFNVFMSEKDKPVIIDLTGGNPELTPEWVFWWMRLLKKERSNLYLWSDDTLSTNCMFDYLDGKQIHELAEYKNYGKVCCFKGFDDESFSFNCRVNSKQFDAQFENFTKYLNCGFDLYAYVTLTTPTTNNIEVRVKKFIDRLQKIHELLPLRTIPLKIIEYGPTSKRMNEHHKQSLSNQFLAKDIWLSEIDRRYTGEQKNTNIALINLK